jgi:hypothetical protein
VLQARGQLALCDIEGLDERLGRKIAESQRRWLAVNRIQAKSYRG